MSHETLYASTLDQHLQERVTAGAQREARSSTELSGTPFAAQLRDTPSLALAAFMWPVAIDYETEYAYAVDAGNPDPGGDEGVISDANISAAVATHWPDG